MVKHQKDKSTWQLVVRGEQCEPLEADLLAQIVLMLGRQLAQETMVDEVTSDDLAVVPPDQEDVS